ETCCEAVTTQRDSRRMNLADASVIAVVIFVVMTILAITARFLYRRKETYHSQEVKEVKQEDSQDFHYNHQADSHSVSGENPKEFFL
uniref:Uncharacterized protein n=1 Tax=Oryzias sinensis TaxID=183150 RepID=A0A8C7X1D5_9TELE